uniref:Uncharacterized protein n=1 Tax=Oryza sativa subsp. japonica TaxID=39947 RepID=Q6Z6Z2_ORYSJ|nr:hypothetical protein [Oryza sativa Japonica Group]
MAVVQLGRGETCREVGPDRRWQRPEVRNAIKTLHGLKPFPQLNGWVVKHSSNSCENGLPNMPFI